MSWTDYPALGERCYFLTLPNGLAVRVLPKPGFAEKFAFLGTNFGSDDMCFTWNGERHTVPDGTAHFLEHRMFSLPDCDPEDAFFPPRRAGERLHRLRHDRLLFFLHRTL